MALILAFLLAIPPAAPSRSSMIPGDLEFSQRDYAGAISTYQTALTSTDSASIYWRLARVEICLGDIAGKDSTEIYYRNAADLARTSVRIDSTTSEGHTWLAVALGSLAVFEGSKAKVQLCNEIKYHLDRAIEINPRNDVAYSILGSFYAALGNISWFERQLAKVFIGRIPDGGYEDAEKALKTAIAIAPNVVRHHYALGMLYTSLDRTAEAKTEFERASTLPVLLARDVNDQEAAREWLKDN